MVHVNLITVLSRNWFWTENTIMSQNRFYRASPNMLPSMDTSQSPGAGERITIWFCHGNMAVQVSFAITDTKLRPESCQRSFSLFPFSC